MDYSQLKLIIYQLDNKWSFSESKMESRFLSEDLSPLLRLFLKKMSLSILKKWRKKNCKKMRFLWIFLTMIRNLILLGGLNWISDRLWIYLQLIMWLHKLMSKLDGQNMWILSLKRKEYFRQPSWIATIQNGIKSFWLQILHT